MGGYFGKPLCDIELGKRIRVGSTLPFDAYDGRGLILLKAGGVITSSSQLDRLLQPDVQMGHYYPPVTQIFADFADDVLPQHTGEGTPDFEEQLARASEVKNEVVADVTSVFTRIESGGNVDTGLARNAVSRLALELADNKHAVVSLVKLKDADSYTFTHSVNVSILAMYIAMHTEYAPFLEAIGTGALLHDIGKVAVPLEILHKVRPLDASDWKALRRHPLHGAQLLYLSGCREDIALGCVLDHHEKLNGRGYPNGKSGTGITPYGAITSIADIYDALTTDRPYRNALDPQRTLTIMTREMAGELDSRLLRCFITGLGEVFEYESQVAGEQQPTMVLPQPLTPPKPAVEHTPVYTSFNAVA